MPCGAKHQGLRLAKTSRIELRATQHDRDLLDRAAAALAAQRVLADREQFVLDHEGQLEWERINSRPARSLPGLARLLGCRGLLVHAESQQTRGFHEHLTPEFERSPTDPLHLLLLNDIRRTLRR